MNKGKLVLFTLSALAFAGAGYWGYRFLSRRRAIKVISENKPNANVELLEKADLGYVKARAKAYEQKAETYFYGGRVYYTATGTAVIK